MTGLTTSEVEERRARGEGETGARSVTKSTGAILRENICTLFNALNFAIAILLFAVGAYSNMLFIAIIILNIVIGIVQEFKAKKLVDELTILNQPHAVVLRDGKETTIEAGDIVKDDVMVLDSGKQICNDAVVIDGRLEVNESLLTGESDSIDKTAGSELYSGSSVISGRAYARVTHVGDENYTNSLINEVRQEKRVHSELLDSMRKVTRFTSFLIIPLGVLLFILKSIDKNAEKEEKAAAQAQADYRSDLGPASAQMAPRQEQDPEAACGTDRPTAEQKSAQNWHKTIAVICTILGAVFLFTGAEELIDCLFDFPDFDDLLPALATTIGGAGALWTGLRMDRTRKLERLLDKIAGDRDNIPLDELFAAAGIDAAKGRAAVESAISHGYFGADAYIDNRTATLVVRGAAPQPPKQPEPKPAPAPADQYAALLQQLRQVNDAIPDPVMTTKISRLEAVSARIFELAKQDPGKKAQLQKFMDYYLPTALKLLNTYASLPAQDVQGENIADAKKNIERSMDLLVTAFENQLDKLFQSDALDVSADVAALEGMLNMDGLTGNEFTK